jgi:hypothetical protein
LSEEEDRDGFLASLKFTITAKAIQIFHTQSPLCWLSLNFRQSAPGGASMQKDSRNCACWRAKASRWHSRTFSRQIPPNCMALDLARTKLWSSQCGFATRILTRWVPRFF